MKKKFCGETFMLVNETKNDVNTNLAATLYTGGPVMAAACGGMAVVFAVLGVVLLLLKSDVFFYAFCFAAAGLLVLFLLFGYKPLLKAALKKSLVGKETLHRFLFREDGFEMSLLRGEQITAKGFVSYQDVKKVVERRDLWLIYVEKSLVIAVARDGMVEGKAEDLSVLFGVKLGERFKSHLKSR